LVLDDALRQIPGFSLFRRSSSMISHPTTQGVSLRGIGPSGTSRTLVLFDGIPWNDPFGGWVYWNRIPRMALESVEVVRGATSPLYGSTALGGTIQLRPSRNQRRLDVRGVLGDHRYADLDLAASDKIGNWGYLAAARVLDTDGFFIVDETLRGEVDTPANSRFETFFGRVSYKGFHVGVNTFRERRSNGTQLQQNDSRIALLETGLEGDSWQGRFYVQSGLFKNTFSRVLSGRSREFVTARQEFPTLGTGGSLTWNPRGQLLLGTDWRRVSWQDRVQNLAGLFVQQTLPLHTRLDLQLGARTDWWQGRTTETSLNPRLGILFRGAQWLTLRSSAYRGFRAPTLNELYRPFRVGNVITAENPDLGEEHLWGGELGADLHPSSNVCSGSTVSGTRFGIRWETPPSPSVPSSSSASGKTWDRSGSGAWSWRRACRATSRGA
jgi:outer membrane receptor protein involved in Fe transport